MSIYTEIACMLLIIERTPNSFEVEQVEVDVSFILFKQLNIQFFFGMRKGTQVKVLAFVRVTRVRSAILHFILFRMVELFHSVVSLPAIVSLGTVFVLAYFHANL